LNVADYCAVIGQLAIAQALLDVASAIREHKQ
jgi:hypothetical protein